MHLRFAPTLVTSAFIALASPALAQTSSPTPAQNAARRVLLEQAQQARAAGNHERALEQAERAGQIQMTPSVRMFIAEEQLELGRIAPAFGSSDACVREAERATTIPNRDAILSRCRELVQQLRPRVGYVTVHVPARVDGLRVTVAGEEIPSALFDAPSVVTPGNVVVEATAAQHAPFRREVAVTSGQTQEVTVELTPTPSSPEPVATAATSSNTTVATTTTATGATGPVDTPRGGGLRAPGVGPIVLMGLGVVGLGLSPVFLALRDGAVGSCTVRADAIACPDEASAMRARSAPGFNTAIYASLGAGGALLVGGVLWWLLTPRDARGSGARTMLNVSPTNGGLLLGFGRGF